MEQAQLTPGLAATLRHAASMHNPVFYERQRMRASTYNIPRFLHSYDETLDGGLILPRGMLGTVTNLAAQAGSRPELPVLPPVVVGWVVKGGQQPVHQAGPALQRHHS